MSKLSILYSLIVLHSALFAPGAVAKWFSGQDVYTLAHQRLLEGNTPESFESMVQAWQHEPNAEQKENLDALLKLAITEDCGRSLSQTALPEWLPNLVIQREVIQNLNQIMLKLSINGVSKTNISEVKLVKWPDQVLIASSPVIDAGGYFSVETRSLEKPLTAGLYQLVINGNEQQSFNHWLLLTAPSTRQRITWKDSKNWRIERGSLPNPACPSPMLSMSLYDLNDTTWTPLWTEDVDGKLPTTLPKIDVSDGRYWLSVGLIESRWQGGISVLDIQTITRPVDYPSF